MIYLIVGIKSPSNTTFVGRFRSCRSWGCVIVSLTYKYCVFIYRCFCIMFYIRHHINNYRQNLNRIVVTTARF
uniref:Uncharacterized protein n=1 Tax=Ascaris lumbricoides TaxID=6252 RepID=A0A0M3HXC8_ASCLU